MCHFTPKVSLMEEWLQTKTVGTQSNTTSTILLPRTMTMTRKSGRLRKKPNECGKRRRKKKKSRRTRPAFARPGFLRNFNSAQFVGRDWEVKLKKAKQFVLIEENGRRPLPEDNGRRRMQTAARPSESLTLSDWFWSHLHTQNYSKSASTGLTTRTLVQSGALEAITRIYNRRQ